MINFKGRNSSIKFKILSIPLVIMMIIIISISSICAVMSRQKILDQMKTDGMNMASQISNHMAKNNNSMNLLKESIQTRIKTLGIFIGNNKDKVNNDYLTVLTKQFEVDEINFVDPSGKILYSNIATSINYVFDNNSVASPVLSGEKNILVENIRKSKESNNYYQYGYVKIEGGGMIQIGILANKIQALTETLQPQTLMDDMVKDKNIVYALIIDKNLKVQAHSDKSRVGKVLDDIGSKTAVKDGKEYSSIYKYKGQADVYDVIVPIIENGQRIGAVDIGLSMESVNKAIRNTILIIIALSIAAFAIATVIMLKITKGIVYPLKNLVDAAQKIADGDLNNNIDVKNNDEIGILASSFKRMSDSLRETIGSIKENSSKIAYMSSDLDTNSEQMTCAANEVSNAIQEVTGGTSQQSSDLVDIGSSLEDLANQLDNIYDKLQNVRESSNITESKTEDGKKQVKELLRSINDVKDSFEKVSEKINSLNSSVSQIGNITEVINNISEQTNLLALNAAIEAARAGEAGRGFAVVAEEVRTLAEQSKNSTEQIQKLVQSISTETKDVILTSESVRGVVNEQANVVKNTMNSFNEMLTAVKDIAPLVDNTYESLKITMESKDIILNKVESVTAISQETSASSEEISASAEELFASSEDVAKFAGTLNEVAQKLNEETYKFKV